MGIGRNTVTVALVMVQNAWVGQLHETWIMDAQHRRFRPFRRIQGRIAPTENRVLRLPHLSALDDKIISTKILIIRQPVPLSLMPFFLLCNIL